MQTFIELKKGVTEEVKNFDAKCPEDTVGKIISAILLSLREHLCATKGSKYVLLFRSNLSVELRMKQINVNEEDILEKSRLISSMDGHLIMKMRNDKGVEEFISTQMKHRIKRYWLKEAEIAISELGIED